MKMDFSKVLEKMSLVDNWKLISVSNGPSYYYAILKKVPRCVHFSILLRSWAKHCQTNFLSPRSGIQGSNTNLRKRKTYIYLDQSSFLFPRLTSTYRCFKNKANLLRLNLKITYNKCDFPVQFCSRSYMKLV